MRQGSSLKVNPMNELSIVFLNESFKYSPEDGALIWRKRPSDHFATISGWKRFNSRFAGKVAGTVNGQGYIQVKINGVAHNAHRIAWAIHNSIWPDGEVDHISGDKLDNRAVNLRLVSHAENCKNQRLSTANNSGRTGVSLDKRDGTWCAYIMGPDKQIYLGRSKDLNEVALLRESAERELGYHRNHGSGKPAI